MKVFAQNFRGFKDVEIDLDKLSFLVGDNSSGKSSILHLVEAVTRNDLHDVPKLDENFGVSEYDYFSPYFDNADVIFGFSSEKDGKLLIKIVTVRIGRHSRPPEMIKCSYLVGDTFISFLKEKSALYVKIYVGLDSLDRFSAIDLHQSIDGFEKVESIKEISLGNPTLVIVATDHKSLNLSGTINDIFKLSLGSARLSSATRALPEKFYTFKRKFNAQGLHFATMWFDFSTDKSANIFQSVEQFGQESGLFDKIKVRKVSSRIKDSPLIVSVVKSEREFLLNQVGVGVSQIVPVLVDFIFSINESDTVILVQQPELHLHPIAQAAFGSFLYKSAEKGLRGLIETHSSYLMDRFRSEIRDAAKNSSGNLINQDVAIIFCRNTAVGNDISEITISNDGVLRNDPEEYHRFFVDEMLRTMF